jgi:hypothetical protein
MKVDELLDRIERLESKAEETRQMLAEIQTFLKGLEWGIILIGIGVLVIIFKVS